MDAPSDNLANANAAPPWAAYCRRCGYSLRGLGGGNCPECGGTFDLSDRRTFARRPPRVRLKWWAWRVGALCVLLAMAWGSVAGWCWWQWRAEQATIEQVEGIGGSVEVKRADATGLGRYLPERWAFLRDRASEVLLRNLTAEQAGRLDLRPLAQVEILSLVDCRVDDAMLAQLRGMTRLNVLVLDGNAIDGPGLAQLAGFRRLEGLYLSRTRLTDAGLAHVGKLTSLTYLWIDGTAVTDAGMAHVAGLTSLDTLNLQGTAVTDAGLLGLRGLTSLRDVTVGRSKVTEQGKGELRKALPKVDVRD